MKKFCTVFPLILSLGFPHAQAQQNNAPTSVESQTLLAIIDRVFDTESDAVDFEEGSFNWKGRTFQFGDGRAMRSRFIRYLNTPVADMDTRVYLALMEDIRGRLSVARQEENAQLADPWRPLVAAWKLLHQAAEHEIDGGNSLVIANVVYDHWRDREMFRNEQFRQSIETDERQRREGRAVAETAIERQRLIEQARQADAARLENLQLPEASNERGITFLDQAMKQLMEQQADVEARGARLVEIGVRSKLKMQSQIISFILQRRFNHALILCSFYRALFNNSAQELAIGQEAIASYLPEFEVVPTVDTLEFIALQALDDINTGMRAVRNSFAQRQLVSALERLQETFFLGEYTLPVIRYDQAEKEVLRQFYFDLREARRLSELRDYDALTELVESLGERADDFPMREATASIRVAKQASRIKLLAAQAAMIRGATEEAEAHLNEAFTIWPLNPEIESFMSGTVTAADLAVEFDLDFANRHYRRIFERRNDYFAAVTGDPRRTGQFQQAIERIQSIDFAVQTAREQFEMGEPHAAWELLHGVAEFASEEAAFNQLFARVTPAVANFAAEIEAAERLEAQGHHSAALTRFLAARDIYPASLTVRRALDRMGERILQQARSLQG